MDSNGDEPTLNNNKNLYIYLSVFIFCYYYNRICPTHYHSEPIYKQGKNN